MSKWILMGMVVPAVACLLLSGCEGGGETRILDVDPKVGHTQGDQTVRIIGQNFRQDIGYTIYFGTKKTSNVAIRNPETIEVTTPNRMEPGPVDIMIRVDDGNAFKITGAFKFEDMGGNVVEGLGGPGAAPKEDKGNLKF